MTPDLAVGIVVGTWSLSIALAALIGAVEDEAGLTLFLLAMLTSVLFLTVSAIRAFAALGGAP